MISAIMERQILSWKDHDRTAQPDDGPLDRYGYVFDHLFQHLIGLLRLSQGRGVEVVYDDSVRKDRNDQWLEIFGCAEGAAFEECHRLRGTVEGLRAARRDSERQEF